MVIANSNSCSTLASLDDVRKIGLNDVQFNKQSAATSYISSSICLPADDLDDEIDYYSSSKRQQQLYLPADKDEAVDVCLGAIPEVMESADELLSQTPRHFSVESSERLLYVAQTEVAHATAAHCDVIASDRATTCHILALRSSSSSNGPLVSLAHIDTVGYEQCVRKMVQEHKRFHNDSDEEKKEEETSSCEPVSIDIYIVGGFEDEDDSSRPISNFLIHLLSRIASEDPAHLNMTLRTCAITSMNDDGFSAPIGRGLGVDVVTGEAFLCKVDEAVAGPTPNLRSARLWSGNNNNEETLSLIHSCWSTQMFVQPFHYAALAQADALIALPDPILLNYTSTSPNVEEDTFCQRVRSTLSFMANSPAETVFGAACNQPAVFARVGRTNQWQQQQQF